MSGRTAYSELEARFARANTVRGAISVLRWDHATMMPRGGAEARAEQLATLSTLVHELMNDPVLGECLDAAEADTAACWSVKTSSTLMMPFEPVSTHADTLTVWLPNCRSVDCKIDTSDAKARISVQPGLCRPLWLRSAYPPAQG